MYGLVVYNLEIPALFESKQCFALQRPLFEAHLQVGNAGLPSSPGVKLAIRSV